MNAREMTAEELRAQREELERLAELYGMPPMLLEMLQAFAARLARIEARLDQLVGSSPLQDLIDPYGRRRGEPQGFQQQQGRQDQIDPYVR